MTPKIVPIAANNPVAPAMKIFSLVVKFFSLYFC